jgi:SAM-dependent methyltransferase
MSVRKLLDWIAEPRLAGVSVDSVDLVYLHRDILRSKPMIYGVMGEFYRTCRSLDEQFLSGAGLRIEIGAGSSLMKDFQPEVQVTDIKPATFLDRVLDAQQMDLADGSVRAVYGINCFHHLPEPDRFFSELERVLVPGGGCVLIEPYFGPLAAFLYRRLFTTERFDPADPSWDGSSGQGAMTGANQALSYIIFQRDVSEFARKHPRLAIVEQRRLPNYLRYLSSGGLNFRQLVPNLATGVLRGVERALAPVDHLLALHHAVVLRKPV